MFKNNPSRAGSDPLVEPVLRLYDELRDYRGPATHGPSMRDSIHAHVLAKTLRALPTERTARSSAFGHFLRKNSAAALWIRTMFETSDGQRNLRALLRIELVP